MSVVLIIGAGAAGMMAAVRAAGNGHEVHVFEKNEKAGKKVYITGKGRCNLTNACDPSEFLSHVCTNPKFLYSSFYGFTNEDAVRFFESCGMRTKIERGNRVFPVSDHASDVIRALTGKMEELGVRLHLNTNVTRIVTENGQVTGIETEGPGKGPGRIVRGDAGRAEEALAAFAPDAGGRIETQLPGSKAAAEDRPDLSIIMPVYNHADVIEESIGSLLAQKTRYRVEVILVDDGSTDGAGELLRSHYTRSGRKRKASLQVPRGSLCASCSSAARIHGGKAADDMIQ